MQDLSHPLIIIHENATLYNLYKQTYINRYAGNRTDEFIDTYTDANLITAD